MHIRNRDIQEAARECLVKAGTTFRRDQIEAYQQAIKDEESENPRWVLTQLLENARVAERKQLPLCDDTGIPHVIARVGETCELPKGWILAIQDGIGQGLKDLPGRPMAVRGNPLQRVEQSCGLYAESEALEPAPIILRSCQGTRFELTVLLLGGGPEIRAKTRRIFHRRSIDHVIDEVAAWLTSEIGCLGCTPAVAAIGIGRSQVEASGLMLEAMTEGRLDKQNRYEKAVTAALNKSNVGPLGLGGRVTALGCFIKIGPTRASGVRIVCARPCCCVEPRRFTISLG
jgi:fumarate hydratase subunit alpha